MLIVNGNTAHDSMSAVLMGTTRIFNILYGARHQIHANVGWRKTCERKRE